jgi:hypothetical protein
MVCLRVRSRLLARRVRAAAARGGIFILFLWGRGRVGLLGYLLRDNIALEGSGSGSLSKQFRLTSDGRRKLTRRLGN